MCEDEGGRSRRGKCAKATRENRRQKRKRKTKGREEEEGSGGEQIKVLSVG